MDARFFRAALCAAVVFCSAGASYSTRNFVVKTSDAEFAQQVGEAAERYRRELAVLWLGHELPNWSQPCPLTVKDGPNMGAGGATTFVFNRGEVYGWRMTIQGSRERILDSVLPHEITHMIFASHFRQPLPRWADEGAATSVEHATERTKYRQMLVRFLQNHRGIAFNRMFAMKEYPRDIMPLYAQGHSVVEYLIQQRGHREFVQFLEDGLDSGDWNAAARQHYDFDNLGDLQTRWVSWVAQGSPRLDTPDAPSTVPDSSMVAAANPSTDSGRGQSPNSSIYQRTAADASPTKAFPAAYTPGPASADHERSSSPAATNVPSGNLANDEVDNEGWLPLGTLGPVPSQMADSPPANAQRTAPSRRETATETGGPQTGQLARPQDFQQPRQVILQWSRNPNTGTATR